MPEVLQLYSLIRRLYPPDVIPFAQLITPTNSAKFQEKYKFPALARPEASAPNAVLLGNSGEFTLEGKTEAIGQLVLQANLLQVQTTGDTHAAEKLVATIEEFFADIRGGEAQLPVHEYTTTVQTIAIVRLNVPHDALFSSELTNFLHDVALPNFELPDAHPEMMLATLSWRISYNRDDTDFMYIPKFLTIEPRNGSRPSDLLYYTVSPTNSKIHLEMLSKFEGMISSKAAKDSAKAK